MNSKLKLGICLGLVATSLFTLGCRKKPKPVAMVPVKVSHETDIETWKPTAVRHHPGYGKSISAWSSWKPHLERSLQHLQERTALSPHLSQPQMSKADMIDTLEDLIKASQGSEIHFWRHLDEHFVLLEAKSRQHLPAFFTGYYSPLYWGSLQKSEHFPYPVYAAPHDLKQNPKKYTRTAVEKGQVLKGKGLELCYLSSPLDVFLLQVQGSGTIRFDHGKSMGLGFAGHNGLEYKSLGKMLVDRGRISAQDISLQSIQAYHRRHPQEIEDLMLLNQRYIFFQENDGKPRGSSGAIVEAFHSLATERFANRSYRFAPHLPMLLNVSLPHMGKSTMAVLAQDTGSAIKGEARADIYLGEGPSAERIAGALKHRGQMFIMWPKKIALPRQIGGNPVVDGGMMAK
jgi:membrane-bound lytic murein transglycosylase A